MTYEQRPLRRQKIRHNSANSDLPLTFQLVIAGAKVTPSAATISIYAPGNSTALVSAAAMTISGTLATYSPDTTTTASWPKDTGYRAEIVATYGGTGYTAIMMVDVVGYPLRLSLAWDQLVALDSRIAAMSHNGDEDFSPIIEASRDEMWVLIESKVIGDKKLIEDMILDEAAVSVPFRLLVLANIWRSKGEYEHAEALRKDFGELWRVAASSIKYDEDQDGGESSTPGRARIQLQW